MHRTLCSKNYRGVLRTFLHIQVSRGMLGQGQVSPAGAAGSCCILPAANQGEGRTLLTLSSLGT